MADPTIIKVIVPAQPAVVQVLVPLAPATVRVVDPLGPPGPAGTVAVGSTTTGDPGSPAEVVNVGTPQAAILDFTIPAGEQGVSATVDVGSTVTSSPGGDATVVNVGTNEAAILDFTIPRGDPGPTGPPGSPFPVLNFTALSLTYAGGLLSQTLKVIIGILPTGAVDLVLGVAAQAILVAQITNQILNNIRSLTAISVYYIGGLTDRTGQVILGILAGNYLDFRPGPGALSWFGSGFINAAYVPTPLDPSVLVTLTAFNAFIQYGESTSIGVNAIPAYYTTPSLNGNLVPTPSIKMTAPSLSPPGTLPYAGGGMMAMVEDNLASEVGNTQGSTGLYMAVDAATQWIMATGASLTPPPFVPAAAGKGGATIEVLYGFDSTWIANYDYQHSQISSLIGAGYRLQATPFLHCSNDQKDGTSYHDYLLGSDGISGLRGLVAHAQTLAGNAVHYLCATAASYIVDNPAPTFATTDEALVNPAVHLVLPDYFIPRGQDGTHYTVFGQDWVGSYIGRAFGQLCQGNKPDCNRFVTAYRQANVITGFVRAPKAICVDNIGLAKTQDAGFKILIGSTPWAVLSVTAWGNSFTITLDPAATPTRGTDVTLRYALDYIGQNLNIFHGASGNIVDTTLDYIAVDGVLTARPHVLFPFSATVKEVNA